MPTVLIQAKQALDQGRHDSARSLLGRQAERELERLIRRCPERVDAMLLMGTMLLTLHELDRARRWYERLLLRKCHTAAYRPLARIAHLQQRFGDAAILRARAVEVEPGNHLLWLELACSLLRTGRLGEGMDWLTRTLEADPGFTDARCKWLFYRHYLPKISRARLEERHDPCPEFLDAPAVSHRFADHDRTPSRRLRIGYLSSDLRANSVAYTFEGILHAHRAEAVEVFIYSHLDQPDVVTRRIAKAVDHFRDICGLDPDGVTRMMREDRIDILVSLGTDLDPTRWAICARRPAPIQVDWGSLGAPLGGAIDYRLTDAWRDPLDAQRLSSEPLAYTPSLAFCYRPPDFAPDVTDLPARQQGRVTFGSLNTLMKLNPQVIDLWARVLKACPGSRLLLKFAGGSCEQTRARLRNAFARQGVAPERVDVRGWVAPVDHLRTYHEIDIGLDPFPFNGMVTTLEALWMGVPVVTLGGGENVVACGGQAILSQLKLQALIAADEAAYIARAQSLARNLTSLSRMRQGLRALLHNSSLCDGPLHAREFEQVYRDLWQRWCAQSSTASGMSPLVAAPAAAASPAESIRGSLGTEVTGTDSFDIFFPGNTDIKFSIHKPGVPPALLQAMEAVEEGDIEQARQCIDETLIDQVEALLRAQPQRADVLFLLGMVLRRSEQPERARPWLQRAAACSAHPFIAFELAATYRDSGLLSRAIEVMQAALVSLPDSTELKSTLADYLMKAGRPEQGLNLLQQVIREQPNKAIFSKFLWLSHQRDTLDESLLYRWHRQWSRRYAPTALALSHARRERDLQRPLRVGYISGDFCSHSVAYFFEPLLEAHDPAVVETWGYGNVPHQDSVTDRLKARFNHYRNICGVPDEQVVRWILADGIDILVDLSGHTGENRLGVLARKPAPIQVSFLGYPDTTGMEQVDYRFTDRWADRPEAQVFYSERLVFLDTGFNCYAPPEFAPGIQELPALNNGYLTFGSFNNSTKINDKTVRLWCRVLQALPDAQLLLKFGGGDDAGVQKTFRDRFKDRGVDPQRIRLQGRLPVMEHLKLYHQVDVALDTFPFHGTTTTCEALWMGVPVLSLLGQHHVSRVALSLLSRLGLEIFTASSETELVDKAVSFAGQPEMLAQIRQGLRGTMAVSPLCDKQAYARSVEQAYRQMWHEFQDISR
jgi:predicted O-linked N-acetylglucosamine transferase (SPINDLY family)